MNKFIGSKRIKQLTTLSVILIILATISSIGVIAVVILNLVTISSNTNIERPESLNIGFLMGFGISSIILLCLTQFANTLVFLYFSQNMKGSNKILIALLFCLTSSVTAWLLNIVFSFVFYKRARQEHQQIAQQKITTKRLAMALLGFIVVLSLVLTLFTLRGLGIILDSGIIFYLLPSEPAIISSIIIVIGLIIRIIRTDKKIETKEEQLTLSTN